MFDVLTYQKGGAILRMLERYLGAERFRDGIRHYLKLHEFGNTETHDLWDAIEEATGEPVRRIMDSWIWQGGYPLLTVEPEDGGVSIDPVQVPRRRIARRHRLGRAAPGAVRRRGGASPCSSRPRAPRWSFAPEAAASS